ncbi:isocitrate/isopropylmalate family dehydrogenase, partial [Pseudomonas viridiflava]|uniref:isocitrate/isopropylmalate family dehydrogenase n=1 Tax=Pseudomonas viridiflava TaxID=33069 RepID=UPI001F075494
MNNKKLRIAAIAGDGIGQEVLPEGVRVVQAAAARHGIELEFEYFEWASCDYYLEHGKIIPNHWFEQLKG